MSLELSTFTHPPVSMENPGSRRFKWPNQISYPVHNVPFTAVTVDDDFWSPRIETNRTVTIPYDFPKCEETERIANFAMSRRPATASMWASSSMTPMSSRSSKARLTRCSTILIRNSTPTLTA